MSPTVDEEEARNPCAVFVTPGRLLRLCVCVSKCFYYVIALPTVSFQLGVCDHRLGGTRRSHTILRRQPPQAFLALGEVRDPQLLRLGRVGTITHPAPSRTVRPCCRFTDSGERVTSSIAVDDHQVGRREATR